jgi:hypothetical protein
VGLGRLVTEIAGSKPAGGMNVCHLRLYVVLYSVDRDLCDELIPRPKETYRVSNKDSVYPFSSCFVRTDGQTDVERF